MNGPFQNSTLYISARSPFARRVRIAFLENGVRFEEKVFNVFEPTSELIAANPLGRVPALKLQSDEVLIDSNRILEAFYTLTPSPFHPTDADSLITLCHWSAIAVGLAEKVVEVYLESLRPEPTRDAELIAEAKDIFQRSLTQFEKQIAGKNKKTILATGLSQADFDMGTALAYLSLRVSKDWMREFPNAAKYLENLEARESFQKTRPPAV